MSTTLSETAPSFNLPGVDGRSHSLDDYGDASALVLIQSCNHCPYVQAWEGRLIATQRDYAERGCCRTSAAWSAGATSSSVRRRPTSL